MNQAITLAMTGASGAIYGLRLLQCIVKARRPVYLLVSAPGKVVASMECDVNLGGSSEEVARHLSQRYDAEPGQIQVFGRDQWSAPIASGSSAPQAMVICPCTSSTLSAVAGGSSNNLLERAADVVIKEKRRLVLVLREMPLSVIHIENMLKLARLGVTIMPACPGFYHAPETIQDLVDFVVARILDHLEIEHHLVERWGAE